MVDGARSDIRRVEYPVTGASALGIGAALATLGPARGDAVHAAYTQWTLAWRVDPRPGSSGSTWTAVVDLRLEAIVHLPRWVAPPWAPRELRTAWEVYHRALEAHEHGHLEIASAAGVELGSLLRGLVAPSERALLLEATAVAARVEAAARDRETAYDNEERCSFRSWERVAVDAGLMEERR